MAASTTRMGGQLEPYADIARGFRLNKPAAWNDFDGEAGAASGAGSTSSRGPRPSP